MISVYKIRELVAAFKAQIRTTITGVGTEDKTDHGLIGNVAASMFQTAQVGAVAIYEQLFPATADATNRDRFVDYHGLDFTKEATTARGLILLHGAVAGAPYTLPAGSQIDFPATCFPDGVARSYVTTTSGLFTNWIWGSTAGGTRTVGTGSTERKVKFAGTGAPAGRLEYVAKRDVLHITNSGLDIQSSNAVKSVNGWSKAGDTLGDDSVDLYFQHYAKPASGDTIYGRAWACVVEAECTVPGKIGNYNGPAFIEAVTGKVYTDARIIEMGGGGDAVTLIDTDERVIRMVEDTIAGAPSFGNPQQLRELALSCPYVDIDDAVVFSHARGPGTVDIVAIGRSGRVASALFPDARNDFFMGNFRRIGEVAAKKLEDWINEKDAQGAFVRLSYFDDVKVRSVEYDWNGETYDMWSTYDFYRSTTELEIVVDALPGYGPDCGVAIDNAMSTYVTFTRLYPATPGIDPSLKVGHRVWVVLRRFSQDRLPTLTYVTEIVAIPPDRTYVEIADWRGAVNATEPGLSYYTLPIRWGSAGPLTQPIIDAVHDYFDKLGPGGYTDPPKGPGYLRAFVPSLPIIPQPGTSLSRWPPEGRRWSGSLRASELNARVLAIKGVRSAPFNQILSSVTIDFDPLVFQTLAFRSVLPRYL